MWKQQAIAGKKNAESAQIVSMTQQITEGALKTVSGKIIQMEHAHAFVSPVCSRPPFVPPVCASAIRIASMCASTVRIPSVVEATIRISIVFASNERPPAVAQTSVAPHPTSVVPSAFPHASVPSPPQESAPPPQEAVPPINHPYRSLRHQYRPIGHRYRSRRHQYRLPTTTNVPLLGSNQYYNKMRKVANPHGVKYPHPVWKLAIRSRYAVGTASRSAESIAFQIAHKLPEGVCRIETSMRLPNLTFGELINFPDSLFGLNDSGECVRWAQT